MKRLLEFLRALWSLGDEITPAVVPARRSPRGDIETGVYYQDLTEPLDNPPPLYVLNLEPGATSYQVFIPGKYIRAHGSRPPVVVAGARLVLETDGEPIPLGYIIGAN